MTKLKSTSSKAYEEKRRTTSPFVGIAVLLALAIGLPILVYQISDSATQRAFQDIFPGFLPAFIALRALLVIAVVCLIIYGLGALWQGNKVGRVFIEIMIIFFALQVIFLLLGFSFIIITLSIMRGQPGVLLIGIFPIPVLLLAVLFFPGIGPTTLAIKKNRKRG